jgi:hypothetical protein
MDGFGNLHGTAQSSGAFGFGGVFKLTVSNDDTRPETAVHNFTGRADGANPGTGVIFATGGNLYGTTIRRWSGTERRGV